MLKYEDIKMPEELYFYMKKFNYGYLTKKGNVIKKDRFMFDELCYNNYVLQNTNDLNNSKTGICFDLTEFARNWFIEHNYQVKTYHEYVNNDLSFSHSFVVYNEKRFGLTWNWLETTWKSCDGIHIYNDLESLHKANYKLYKEELKKNAINCKDIKVVEFNAPKEHSSLEEYLKNARRGNVLVLRNR